ncbi:MTRF1L release factor glutamine methyltransferase isoform X2 [Trachemys scripta elegans]|nr:MTRF1L release factor glutamine methyltransferase isoform X2 [Trachemys scripta elegans]
MKRLQRMPVQYVLGEWDFRELTLKMRPPVFIPRPETEELVSLVLEEELQRSGSPAVIAGHQCPTVVPHPVILEIGCGSGAIALSLLSKLPKSRVIAVDKEEAAVNLTRENAQSKREVPTSPGSLGNLSNAESSEVAATGQDKNSSLQCLLRFPAAAPPLGSCGHYSQ